jgi:hypothetical protein
VENTLAYCDTVKITALESFTVQTTEKIERNFHSFGKPDRFKVTEESLQTNKVVLLLKKRLIQPKNVYKMDPWDQGSML